MMVNIYTTSGGITPETFTNVVNVIVSRGSIMVTEKTSGRTTVRTIELSDVTSITVTGVGT